MREPKSAGRRSIISAHWQSVGRFACLAYAAGWGLTGILFFVAGVLAPVRLDPADTHSPERLAAFFDQLQHGWGYYALAFAVFTAADFFMIVVGAVVRELLGRQDFRAQVVFLTFAVGGLFGMLVDVGLLSSWLVIGTVGPAVAPTAQSALWVAVVELQSFGVWLSAAGFTFGGAGMLWLSRLATERGLPTGWCRLSLAFGAVIYLELAAIIVDVAFGTQGLLSGTIFLLLTTVIAPLWAVWLARIVGAAH